MRLLYQEQDGRLGMTDDLLEESRLPPYAILSHTWGKDEEEATFEDVRNSTGTDKPGYEKIRLCGEQAKNDGLRYFWVDTCCIKKTNKAELSLAIRSMFRWYRNAVRCYVYLTDVSTSPGLEEATNRPVWEKEFRKSKWFTRGWTLQELIAPSTVEFFSCDWRKLGDRASLKYQIHEVTTIPHAVLEGAPLSQTTIDERRGWGRDRHTKLDEDAAYSLSGVLDVELTPVYGEGREEAFRRLHDEIRKREDCLRDLRPTDPRDDKKRIEETKGGLLEGSYGWVLNNSSFQQWYNNPQSQLLWVKGDPGKGKTMLLCGIIDKLEETIPRTASLSYFFCQATDSRINSATAVLRGLLYLIISQQPALIVHARKKYDQAGKAVFEDANAWIALTEIFADVLQDTSLGVSYIMVDALDECVIDLQKLIRFITKQSSASSCTKWIVSSRNQSDIEEQFEGAWQSTRLSLELNAESVSAAVGVFIQSKISRLACLNKYDKETQDAVFERLTSNANDTFLWVALVCQDLEQTPRRHVRRKLASFPPGLDALYKRMMQQIDETDDAGYCKQVLAVIALVHRPITLVELIVLADLPGDLANEADVREIIRSCGSFITLQEEIIFLIHQSALDFLLLRASGEIFPGSKETVHETIFLRSLDILSDTLHRDMFGLEAPGTFIDDVESPTPDPLAASRYSCVYWIDHLASSRCRSQAHGTKDVQIRNALGEFLERRYLYWLEGLSLCNSMPRGAASMARLCLIVQGIQHMSKLTEIVRDAYRFILYHKKSIESYPLQSYASALVFSPTESKIRKLFQHESPDEIIIKSAMNSLWSACLQTLEGHTAAVYSVAYSNDGTRLASGSADKTIRTWDATSGLCLRTFNGHEATVFSVIFSRDGARLVSASADTTVKVWDSDRGACLYTLEGHALAVKSVALFHNEARLVSASDDKTIKIWDAHRGLCLQTLEGHTKAVTSVALSYDDTRLASGSYDATVKVWDAGSGVCLESFKGHSHWVHGVAFSRDVTRLASGSYDETVKIWDMDGGACVQTLEGHVGTVLSVAFSHNGILVASASLDTTIKVWDVVSGVCLQIFQGHSNWVHSLAFSYDSTRLASASLDATVKIWDMNNGESQAMSEDHAKAVSSISFSKDATWLVSSSGDGTIKTWDVESRACLQTFRGHAGKVFSAALSHDLMLLASISRDCTTKIWNAKTGACLRTLQGGDSGYELGTLTFSYDTNWLASASSERSVKIWHVNSGTCLHTFEVYSCFRVSLAFSHDDTRLASTSDSLVRIWDTDNGDCLQILGAGIRDNSAQTFSQVAFSHNGSWLASTSWGGTVQLWNASNGECLHTFNLGTVAHNISFNATDTCLLTESGALAIRSLPSGDIALLSHPDYQRIALDRGKSDSRWTWITYRSKRVLWLPSDYSSDIVTISEDTIAFGLRSGKVWLCTIKP